MSVLPTKRCKTCDFIFTSPKIGRKIVCPRCGGRSLADATASELAHEKKIKAQEMLNKKK